MNKRVHEVAQGKGDDHVTRTNRLSVRGFLTYLRWRDAIIPDVGIERSREAMRDVCFMVNLKDHLRALELAIEFHENAEGRDA